MNARGQEQYIIYFTLVLLFVAGAGFLLSMFVNNVGDASTYQRLMFAEDLGLTLTALHATDTNIAAAYIAPSLNRFSYTITPGEIIVHEGGKQDVVSVYAQDLDTPLITQKEETLLTPKNIHLLKGGNTLSATFTRKEQPTLHTCPETLQALTVGLVIPPLYKGIADGARRANQKLYITESRLTTTSEFTIEIAAHNGPLQIAIPTEQDYAAAYAIACKIANQIMLQTQEPVIIYPVSITAYPSLKGKQGFVIEADHAIHTTATGDAIGRGLP